MRLKRIAVKGYRSLLEVELKLDSLTSLIGRNGSGKSSTLHAISLLFDPKATVEEADFWKGSPDDQESATAAEISITAAFGDLSPRASAVFADYLIDEELVIEKRFDGPGVGSYLALKQSIPQFADIRNLSTGHRQAFDTLRSSPPFEDLGKAANRAEVLVEMDKWEKTHREAREEVQEAVQFFSESAESPTAMANHVTFILVGALEEPEVHLDSSRSSGALGRLVQELVPTRAIQTELDEVASRAATDANEVLAAHSADLDSVSRDVEEVLHNFAPGLGLRLAWEDMAASSRRPPRIRVTVSGQGKLETDLSRQGHGVQRSLMYGVLTAASGGVQSKNDRTVLLAIEEPEAFQHPLSSRVLGRTLKDLSAGAFQVVYSTHSPYFVQPQAVGGLRLVRLEDDDASASTSIDEFSVADFVEAQNYANDRDDFTPESAVARLTANLENRILEGLFATACVLVEGDQDEALLRGACAAAGVGLDDRGIAVIQTRGKTSMPLVLGFLRQAGVPSYPVFDLDRNRPQEKQNRGAELAITRFVRGTADELDGNEVAADMAYWKHNLGDCIQSEMGGDYEQILSRVSEEMGYVLKQGRKVAPVLERSLIEARDAGLVSESLEALAARVARLGDS